MEPPRYNVEVEFNGPEADKIVQAAERLGLPMAAAIVALASAAAAAVLAGTPLIG